MSGFPDESLMPKSPESGDPIRGGSIGFNRVLGYFVHAAGFDRKPQFNAVLISAFTIFRNVWDNNKDLPLIGLEELFVKDVNLFLEYYNEYLLSVSGRVLGDRFCPVVIYFPNYHRVPKDIQREHRGQAIDLFKLYKTFLAKHGRTDGEVKRLQRVRCFWMRVGDAAYPHIEMIRKFRDITSHKECLFISGDPICLITHIRLDYYLAHRIQNVVLLESYQGTIRKPSEFKLKWDKEGRVPFLSCVHVALGDNTLIKQMVTPKVKKAILEASEKDKWLTRSSDDVLKRISDLSGISTQDLRRYDFG